MPMQLMEEISAAEKQAEEQKQKSLQESREMIKSVEEACMEQERAYQQEMRVLYQDEINKKQSVIEKEISSNLDSKKKEIEDMAQKAHLNIDKAASFVFERIISNGNR